MKRHNSLNGFTLIEMMSVVVILALLIAFALPAFQSALTKSDTTKSISNLRQLTLANISYATDRGHYAPADDRDNNMRWHGGRTSSSQPFKPAKGYLAPYLSYSRQVSVCPVLKRILRPGDESFEEGTGGYGYNSSYIGGTPAWSWNEDGSRVSASIFEIVQPSTTIMFASTAYAKGTHLQEYPYTEPPFWDFGSGPSGYRPSPTTHFRFQGKALVAWCDGHVSLVAKEARAAGTNPHEGDAEKQQLGWFGSDHENGYWNPGREP